MIREELNVKEVKKLENIDEYATMTYAPDARKIGQSDRKMFMKEILSKSKSGDVEVDGENLLVRIPNTKYQIPNDDSSDSWLLTPDSSWIKVILQPDEFEVRYIPNEGTDLKFEAGFGTVVGIDDVLTDELIDEGYARDIIRLIQDGRKEAGFEVTDRIVFSISGDDRLVHVVEQHQEMIAQEVLWVYDENMGVGDKAVMVELDGMSAEVFLVKKG